MQRSAKAEIQRRDKPVLSSLTACAGLYEDTGGLGVCFLCLKFLMGNGLIR